MIYSPRSDAILLLVTRRDPVGREDLCVYHSPKSTLAEAAVQAASDLVPLEQQREGWMILSVQVFTPGYHMVVERIPPAEAAPWWRVVA